MDQVVSGLDPKSWRKWAASAVILTMISAGFVVFDRWTQSERHRLATLASAMPAQRHFEGRIAGFHYRPFLRRVTRGTIDDSLLTDTAALSFLSSSQTVLRSMRPSSAADYHLLAISKLVVGDTRGAVDAFERSLVLDTGIRDPQRATEVSTNARLLTDLSAAYSERGTQERKAADHIRALECADRAWHLWPSDESRWNRAVSLQALSLSADARDAWRDYLQKDSVSAWADEARERLAHTLAVSPDASIWQRDGSRLRELSREDVERLSTLFPLQVRRAVEQKILPEWAIAVRDNDATGAAAALERARWIADALRRSSGESLLFDVVSNVDRSDTATRKTLARCVLAIADAKTAYEQNNGDGCRAQLRSVLSDLERCGSPLVHYARFYIASSYYFDNDYVSLRREAATLTNVPSRYRVLRAQTSWILGLGEMAAGRPETAVQHYDTALRGFNQLGETELAGAVDNLLAEAYEYLDNRDEAWGHRERALETFSRFSAGPYYIPLLQQSAQLLLVTGQPAVAKIFLDRTLKIPAVSDPLLFVDTLSWEATALHDMRRIEEAKSMWRRAASAAEQITLAPLRERARNDVMLTQALTFERGNTPGDVRRAVTVARSGDNRWALPRLLRLYADVLARQGQYAAAMSGYWAAVDEIVDQRRKASASQYEMLNRANLIDTTDHALSLAIMRGDYEGAFAFSEHSAGAAFRQSPPAPARLPANVGVIKTVWLPDRIVIWTITSRRTTVRQVSFPRDSWVNAGDEERASLLGRIGITHDMAGTAVDSLVFVPDAATANVCFESLTDATTRRPLGDRYLIAECPTVAAYLGAADRAGTHRGLPLLVSGTEGGGLARLPEVSAEVHSLRLLYPSATTWEARPGPTDGLQAALQDAGLIHFASHGVVDRANESLSNLVLGDGTVLYAHEIAQLRLKRRPIVVLSTCSGAATAALRHRRAPTLADAFLAAGASAVVAWSGPVDDAVARRASLLLHERLNRGVSVGAAVGEVRRKLATKRASSDLVVIGDPNATFSTGPNV